MSTIGTHHILAGNGKQYEANFGYDKDGNPRGYYLTIHEVEIERKELDGRVYYSTETALFANDFKRYLLQEVTRASKNAEMIASNEVLEYIDLYFEKRHLAWISANRALLALDTDRKNGADDRGKHIDKELNRIYNKLEEMQVEKIAEQQENKKFLEEHFIIREVC